MPLITVEFFGIPQARMNCSSLTMQADTIGAVLRELSLQSKEFRNSCLANDQLKPEFLISINGKVFTRDPTCQLHDNDSILILSADVGG